VLRLPDGSEVEIFDSQGRTALGKLLFTEAGGVAVKVEHIAERAGSSGVRVVVASAIPKGERADWMIEKLSELGVAHFIPLAAERSVTLPKGTTKFDRWGRIATEAAKQSRRKGVMSIAKLTSLDALLSDSQPAYVLSSTAGAIPITEALSDSRDTILLVVGPEGGWTEQESERFACTGHQQVALTETILRTETAAIAAATIATLFAGKRPKLEKSGNDQLNGHRR
jgi:16S rRNA (uracil1498-N3)-methyltransferase